MRLGNAIFALAAVALLSACATVGGTRFALGGDRITREDLLETSPLRKGTGPAEPADILALTPEMVAFLDRNVDRSRNPHAQLKQLLHAVLQPGRFELVYDDVTRTAAETFRERRGNCMSFTNLFVALARDVGLDARFQEVEIPPNWTQTADSFLLSKHINVYVELGRHNDQTVDFLFYARSSGYPSRVVSDRRARAHFHNNLGVERMLEDDTAGALQQYLASIAADRSFTPTWVNLGVLHRREGYPQFAEAAFRFALDKDSHDLVAMSNLANLYDEYGQSELARVYRNRVTSHRMQNPYYRYYLADEAFSRGDYAEAIGHLRYAIREQRYDDRFYALLGISYQMNGNRAAAQRWLKKAVDVAALESDRQRYQSKLDLLAGHTAD